MTWKQYSWFLAATVLILSIFFAAKQFSQTINLIAFKDLEKFEFEPPIDKDDNNLWLFGVQQRVKKPKPYPTTEIQLTWNLVDPELKKSTVYKVEFKDLNQYQYFCLVQVLNNYNLNFAVEKIKRRFLVHLDVNSKNLLNVLIQELKQYDIYATVKATKTKVSY